MYLCSKIAIVDFIGVTLAARLQTSAKMIGEHARENRSLSEATVISGAKFRDCAQHARYDKQKITQTEDRILNLENVEDISALADLFGRHNEK